MARDQGPSMAAQSASATTGGHTRHLQSRLPFSIAPARPVIAHVQLRDLIIAPYEPGVVNYVVHNAIVEQDMHAYGAPVRKLTDNLPFTPISLTHLPIDETDTLIAAGGQDKEIHLSYYTSSSSTPPISTSAYYSSNKRRNSHGLLHERRRRTKLWEFNDVMTGSINNSVLLTTALNLTKSGESSVEPRVGISNNDGSVKMYDIPIRGANRGTKQLNEVGRVWLGEPINHSSISPDGRTLVSVGDSRKIYLHHIHPGARVTFSKINTSLELPAPDMSKLIDAYDAAAASGASTRSSTSPSRPSSTHPYLGNRQYTPGSPSPSYRYPSYSHLSFLGYQSYSYATSINGLTGAGGAAGTLAASFSTAFSGDGSKFAVAGQEGVVAIWDVRYLGKPMRVWETDKMRGVPGRWRGDSSNVRDSSGFGTDSDGDGFDDASGWISSIVDPWEWPRGSNAPGWCVRSVKFGKSKGGKEVMAFTEHTSLVHVVDARTFETEDVVRVPTLRHTATSSSRARSTSSYPRSTSAPGRSYSSSFTAGTIRTDDNRVRRAMRTGAMERAGMTRARYPGRFNSSGSGSNGGSNSNGVLGTTTPVSNVRGEGSSTDGLNGDGNASGSTGVGSARLLTEALARRRRFREDAARRNRSWAGIGSDDEDEDENADSGAGAGSSWPETNHLTHSIGLRLRSRSNSRTRGSGSGSAASGTGILYPASPLRYSLTSPPGNVSSTRATRASPSSNGRGSTSPSRVPPSGRTSQTSTTMSTTRTVSPTRISARISPTSTSNTPGIVQALGDAFRITLPSSSSSASMTTAQAGSRPASISTSPAATSNANSTSRVSYSPPASIGDSTWRTLGVPSLSLGSSGSNTGANAGNSTNPSITAAVDSAAAEARAFEGGLTGVALMRFLSEERERRDRVTDNEERAWERAIRESEPVRETSQRNQEEDGIVVVPDLGDRDVESELRAVLAMHGIRSRFGSVGEGDDESTLYGNAISSGGDFPVEDRQTMLERMNSEASNEVMMRWDMEHDDDGGDDMMDVDVGAPQDEVQYGAEQDHDHRMEDGEDNDEEERRFDLYSNYTRSVTPTEIIESESRASSPWPRRNGFVGRYEHAPWERDSRYSPSDFEYDDDDEVEGYHHPSNPNNTESQAYLDAKRRRLSAYGKVYYRPDLDIAGLCFDPSGERMYVLGAIQPDADETRSGFYSGEDLGWGDEDEENVEEGTSGEKKPKTGGAVVEWKIKGARKTWWVDGDDRLGGVGWM